MNNLGRFPLLALQGLYKGLGGQYVAEALPFTELPSRDIITPQNALERAMETGSSFTGTTVPVTKAMSVISKAPSVANTLAQSKIGRLIADALKPAAAPLEYAGAFGAGAATGAIEPDSIAGKIASALAGGTLGAGAVSATSAFGPGVVRNFIGRNALREELANALAGRPVSDVNFGILPRKKLSEINHIRDMENVPRIESGRVVIPEDRVRHLYEKRRLKDKYLPQEIANTLNDALFNKKTQISRGRYPTLQTMFSQDGHLVNVGIIGKNKNAQNVFIKTGYKKDLSDVKTGALDGRRVPSSDPLTRTQSASGSRQVDHLSARQSPVDNIMGYARDFVKQFAENPTIEMLIRNALIPRWE